MLDEKGKDKQYLFTTSAGWFWNSSHSRPIFSGDLLVVVYIPNYDKIVFLETD